MCAKPDCPETSDARWILAGLHDPNRKPRRWTAFDDAVAEQEAPLPEWSE
jgi:hypothetical protein